MGVGLSIARGRLLGGRLLLVYLRCSVQRNLLNYLPLGLTIEAMMVPLSKKCRIPRVVRVVVMALGVSIWWTLVLGALRRMERWWHLVPILLGWMATPLVLVTVWVVHTAWTPCLVLVWQFVCRVLVAAWSPP